MGRVGLKLSTMKDTDMHIQDDRRSWMELIEGDDHRLTKAACRLVDQRRDGHLILPWTRGRHLMEVFGSSMKTGSTSMAELIQATKVYYSTVEGFVTSDPPLLNLRRVADHMERERHMYVYGGEGFLHMENEEVCGDTLMNGHWEELIGKVEGLLHATDDPDNCHMHIRAIIQYSSDGRRFESFLRTMSSSSVSGCASTLVGFQQQLVKRAD